MPSPGGRRERLGILGGTFDPPHTGHVHTATVCRDQLALDRVLFVVANDPWQKSPLRQVTPAEDRLAMVEAAVHDVPGAEVSRIEIERGGPSYTIDTVEALIGAAQERGAPAPELFLIVGADVMDTLSTWHRADELARCVTLAVVVRPGVEPVAGVPGWRSEVVRGPGVDVSSSGIRAEIGAGRPIEGLVPGPVERYIEGRGLYR